MFTGSVLRAWIGLFDLTEKHLWKWVSDQSRAIYVDWASPMIVMKIVLKCIWQVIMANGMTFNVLIGGNSYVKSLNKVLLIHYIKNCMYFFSNKPN